MGVCGGSVGVGGVRVGCGGCVGEGWGVVWGWVGCVCVGWWGLCVDVGVWVAGGGCGWGWGVQRGGVTRAAAAIGLLA